MAKAPSGQMGTAPGDFSGPGCTTGPVPGRSWHQPTCLGKPHHRKSLCKGAQANADKFKDAPFLLAQALHSQQSAPYTPAGNSQMPSGVTPCSATSPVLPGAALMLLLRGQRSSWGESQPTPLLGHAQLLTLQVWLAL